MAVPRYLTQQEINDLLACGIMKTTADTTAYIANDISTITEAYEKFTKEFNDYKENNMKKEVLFLSPSWQYTKTVIQNLSKACDRQKIPHAATPNEFETDGVHVYFDHSDPLKWNEAKFHGSGVVAIFGKKELVETAKKKFFHDMPQTPKMSLEKYILENTKSAAIEVTPPTSYLPEIKKVHFSGPATTVLWTDGTKTTVQCQDGDIYSEESGLALCIAKKAYGNMPNFNNIFRKWVSETTASNTIDLSGLDEIIRKEAKKQKAIQTAYNLVNDCLNTSDEGGEAFIDLEEIRGYLGEALE